MRRDRVDPNATRPSAFSCRPHSHLFENNTWIWLNGLTRKAKRIIRPEDVPDQGWDALQDGGDCMWLMGLWESSHSRKMAAIIRIYGSNVIRRFLDGRSWMWGPYSILSGGVPVYPELASWSYLSVSSTSSLVFPE